jgi:acyl-CoA reductase-like NAD-dependent aldehyde dehydrogenase
MAISTETHEAATPPVDGTTSPARADIEVRNPATGAFVARVPVTTPDEVAAAVRAARAAQPGWLAMGFEGRAAILLRIRRRLLEDAERVIHTIVSETGKTYEDALVAEISYSAFAFGFWAKHAPRYLADQPVHPSNPFLRGRRAFVRFAPVGVVGVIGPWNYPLTNSFGDCIAALAAGNAVVLKPSEVTPLTSLLMRDMLRECGVPEGVFQVVPGAGQTGEALVDHVDYVMFTGSTRTGRRVAERCARRLIPCGLELGGKDPMIVLEDADLERAANSAVFYSMQNGGQTCISIERLYVVDAVYDDFVKRVAEKVRALRQGPGDEPGEAEVGALTFAPQLDIVRRHVADAVARGARVLTGGNAGSGPGRFFEPTVLVDVDHSMEAMREETFGPTLPIMRVPDEDEAVRLANDSPYGLQASVWTKDLARGERIARRLEAGTVCVNDAVINYLALELPMGGWKESGLGRRHGPDGIRKYCRQQSILVTRFALRRELHMYPHRKRTTRLLLRAVRLLWGRGPRT